MGCGCNKNKNQKCVGSDCEAQSEKNDIQMEHLLAHENKWTQSSNINTTNSPPWLKSKKDFNMTQEFKSREIQSTNPITKGFGMATSFISAIASKGINSEKVNVPLKQLRVISCFGNKDTGGVLPPCEYLQKSATPGKFFCGGCGCGDKPLTWLNGTSNEYSKLDYPKLSCPLQMPGFSNYKESTPEESISPMTRRAYIEKMKLEELTIIPVTSPEDPGT